VQAVVRRFADHPALFGWILTNEIPNMTGPVSPEKATAWMAAMYQAITAIDSKHPVGTGDGARCEARMDYDGFRSEHILPFVDYFGNHLYNYYDSDMGNNDPLRWSYAYSCRSRYNSGLGKPVFQEEFGTCQDEDTEEHQADFYRVLLYSTLINGSCGAMPWGLTDFVMEDWVPYSYWSQELNYGMVKADGTERLNAAEMRRFGTFAQSLDLERYKLEKPQVAVLIPSAMYVDYPYYPVEGGRRRVLDYRILQTAFTLSKTGGADTAFVRERPEPVFFDPSRLPAEAYDLSPYRLLVLPNIWTLLTAGWRNLYSYASDGGCVYLSYSGVHGGIRCPIFEQLFGVRHQLRYGISEIPQGSAVNLRFCRDFYGISEGETISVPISGKAPATAHCPVVPTTAEVIAVDDQGLPALVVNAIGKGKVVFSAYPLEYYVFNTYEGNTTTQVDRLYHALARMAGVETPASCDNRFLELGMFKQSDGGDSILIVVNHSWETQRATLQAPGNLYDLEAGKKLDGNSIELAKKQVAVLSVR
jgi:endo-1,4-beta-mannosidase